MKKLFFMMIGLACSLTSASDSFLNSCQKQWQANAASMKSMRADLVQSVEVNGQKNEQLSKVQYLNSDRFYSKMETDSQLGKMTVICRGDSTYVKMAETGWQVKQDACAENPLENAVQKLKNTKFHFVKDSSGTRIYQDTEKVRYVFEAKTCRMVSMNVTQNGAQGISRLFYKKFDGVDVPVKIEIDVQTQGNVKSIIEYRSVLINKGVTQSFFDLK